MKAKEVKKNNKNEEQTATISNAFWYTFNDT